MKVLLMLIPFLIGLVLSVLSVEMQSFAKSHPHIGAHFGTIGWLGTTFIHAGAGMIFWSVVDHTVLEWFSVKDCIHGKEEWFEVPDIVRAFGALGYFLLFGCVMLTFSQVGI